MSSWALVCDVHFLEPQKKGENESSTEFAERVQAMIAAKAGLKIAKWDGYLKYYNLVRHLLGHCPCCHVTFPGREEAGADSQASGGVCVSVAATLASVCYTCARLIINIMLLGSAKLGIQRLVAALQNCQSSPAQALQRALLKHKR